MEIRLRALSAVLLAAASAGCTLLDTTRMVPDTAGGPERKIPLRVRVAPVTGGDDGFFGGPRMLGDEELTRAVVDTLKKARLFADVSTTAGDVELRAVVLHQDQIAARATGGATARMLVVYRFVDAAGRTLWLETYDTAYTHVAFAGATRTSLAREGAARENLAAFARGVRERWPAR